MSLEPSRDTLSLALDFVLVVTAVFGTVMSSVFLGTWVTNYPGVSNSLLYYRGSFTGVSILIINGIYVENIQGN